MKTVKKNLIKATLGLAVLAMVLVQPQRAYAGRDEWATAGKILTGVVAAQILLGALPCVEPQVTVYERRVVAASCPTVVVREAYCPPPPPVVVYRTYGWPAPRVYVPSRPYYGDGGNPHYGGGQFGGWRDDRWDGHDRGHDGRDWGRNGGDDRRDSGRGPARDGGRH